MCQFFSLVSDGKGKIYYFDFEIRRKIRNGELDYEQDSHTSIADYFGFKGEKEDTLNKYEYNPLTKKLTIDQLNVSDDSEKVKKFCENLNFKTIIPELTLKPIIDPFEDIQNGAVTDQDIELLKQWSFIWYSVWDSVLDSVWYSVRGSVWGSVRGSVWDSVWDSVLDSVYAYISSFFNLKQWKYIEHEDYKNPFQSCIDLWNKGLVPSFDGKIWRLHGVKGTVLWEGTL